MHFFYSITFADSLSIKRFISSRMRATPELKGVPESSCLVKLTAKNISLNPTTLLKLTSSQVFFNDCSLIFTKTSFTENLMAVSESY